jgi:hypothetical protein
VTALLIHDVKEKGSRIVDINASSRTSTLSSLKANSFSNCILRVVAGRAAQGAAIAPIARHCDATIVDKLSARLE